MEKEKIMGLGVVVLLLLSILTVFANVSSRGYVKDEIRESESKAEIALRENGVDIEMGPEQEIYNQGQEVEIKVSSESGKTLDILINDYENESLGSNVKTWNTKFVNGTWRKNYTIPSQLSDGLYVIRVKEKDSGNESLDQKEFRLKKYEMRAKIDKKAYLPGEEVNVYYTISKIIDGSPADGFGVSYDMRYPNKTYEEQKKSGEVSDGHFSFEIPKEIFVPSKFSLNIQANKNEDYEVSWSGSADVNELEVTFETDRNEYHPGNFVYITVESFVTTDTVIDSRSPVEGAHISMVLENSEENEIDETKRTAATDDSGSVVLPLKLMDDIKKGTYTIKVAAEKNEFSDEIRKDIKIEEREKDLIMQLERDKNSYSPGEEVNVEYAIRKDGESVETELTYVLKRSDSKKIYDMGHAEDGFISFAAPENYNQNSDLILEVSARIDNENQISDQMEIPISGMKLLLNSDSNKYLGGDTINFDYEVLGAKEVETAEYEIMNNQGKVIKTGKSGVGDFKFQVPKIPSHEYEVQLTVVSEDGVKLTEDLKIEKKAGFDLEVNIVTDSDYTTEVYEPSQEIKVHYKVTPRGDENLPDKIAIHYSFLSTGDDHKIQTDSLEGDFTVEVPEDSDGTCHLQVISSFGGKYQNFRTNLEPIKVKENPSVMNRKTIGDISLLNLAVFLLILLIAVASAYYFSGKSKRKTEEAAEKEAEEEKEEEKEPKELVKEKRISPKEEAHGWEGPDEIEEEEEAKIDRIESEDEDQIEPDEPGW